MQQFKVTGYSALLLLVLCLSTSDGFLETDRRTLLRNIDTRKNDQLTNRNFFGSTWQPSSLEERRGNVDTDSRRVSLLRVRREARLIDDKQSRQVSSLDNPGQTRDFRQIKDNNERRERESRLYNSRLLGVSRRETREDNLRSIDNFRRKELNRELNIRQGTGEDSSRRRLREREEGRRSTSLDNSRRQSRLLENSRRESQENRQFSIKSEDSSRFLLLERGNERIARFLDNSHREDSSRFQSRLLANSQRENRHQERRDTIRREIRDNSSRRQLREREDERRSRSLDNSRLYSRLFANSRRENQHQERRDTIRRVREVRERQDERRFQSLDNSRREDSSRLQSRLIANSQRENQHQERRDDIRREIRDNSSRRQLREREDERKSQSLGNFRREDSSRLQSRLLVHSRRENQHQKRRDTSRREVRDDSFRRQIREREDNREFRLLGRNVRENTLRSLDSLQVREHRQSRLLENSHQQDRDTIRRKVREEITRRQSQEMRNQEQQKSSDRRESRRISAEIRVLDRRLTRDNDRVSTPRVSAVRRETRLVSDATRRIALSSKDENNNQRQSSGKRRMATSFRTTENIDYIPEMRSNLLLNAAKIVLISFLVAQVAVNSSKTKKNWFHNLTNFVTVTKEKVL